jgi:hypothetical protein
MGYPRLKPCGSNGTKTILKEITQRYIVCIKVSLYFLWTSFMGNLTAQLQ